MGIYDIINDLKRGLREGVNEYKADKAAMKIARKDARIAYRQEAYKAQIAKAKQDARDKVKTRGSFFKNFGSSVRKHLKETKERNTKNGLYDTKSPFKH